jgi:PPK2 family polyphosphate:nucleotide phosphotransferase
VVLQATDAAGKDGVVRHVLSGLNPQGCDVTSFKVPSTIERQHDFLWRIHQAVPAFGSIGVFNRSHYEDVLVVRVHHLAPRHVWSARYDQINAFEKLMSDNGVTILKFFLHISKAEQKQRLEARLDDPIRNWKISPADFKERRRWNDYVEAYEAVLNRCSSSVTPWYVIPSNKKWFRNLAVSQIIVETLERMNPKFPKPSFDLLRIKVK